MAKRLREFSATERKAAQTQQRTWTDFFKGGKAEADGGAGLEGFAALSGVQATHESALFGLANVVAVGASYKQKGGKPTSTRALTVFVESKLPKSELAKSDIVPAELDGVKTDVVEVGKIEALAFTAKQRPAVPGFSIGHHAITAGTFGCVVEDLRRRDGGGEYLILSNNHVLADVNKGRPGDLILQPGPFAGGQFPSDAVATLDRFEPIVLSAFPNPPGYNLVDAVVARPHESRLITPSIIGLAMPSGISQAVPGMAVIKAGRTTEVTVGVVLATNVTVAVGYGADGIGTFRHQIITTAMAAGGDSGSLLMDLNLNAIGLLFAGSSIITIHNHIADVEVALGVRPLTAAR
jgi:hypothetical protein